MLQAGHMLKLEDLISLALEAGGEINAVRAAGFDAQTKLDGSLVTIADQRAEAIIEELMELDAHLNNEEGEPMTDAPDLFCE